MHPALGGSLSALSLGTADFAARFATRAFGAPNVALGVFSSSFVLLTLYALATGRPAPNMGDGLPFAAVNGVATGGMTILLYLALARGPVSAVAPIVASHPAFVVALWFALGARPSAVEWAGMAGTIAGAVLVAREADARAESRSDIRMTLLLSAAACIAYVFLVAGGQMAASRYAPFDALWVGRGFSLLTATLLLPFSRMVGLGPAPRLPARAWLPLIGLGVLDASGYLFLFLGSTGEGKAIAAVTGSAFGAVTVLLAWLLLKEKISAVQWFGVALVTAGVGVLAAQSA